MVRFWLALVLVLVVLAGGARAELQSLFPRNEEIPDTVTRAGLFAPTGNQGFFAPLPERAERVRVSPLASGTGTAQVDRLLSLIARAEAGSAGYNAVQHGATWCKGQARRPAHTNDAWRNLSMDQRHPRPAPRHWSIPVHPAHATPRCTGTRVWARNPVHAGGARCVGVGAVKRCRLRAFSGGGVGSSPLHAQPRADLGRLASVN
jgi:hypothetical protein